MYRLMLCAVLVLLAAGCGTAPTAIPFATLTAQNVLDALAAANLDVINVQRAMPGSERDAPATFSDRYTFEIGSIAPQQGDRCWSLTVTPICRPGAIISNSFVMTA
ncbi:MAG: hypothetical protein U0694_22500 [Anaerolineae bacterium]